MFSHHSDEMFQMSKVSEIILWRCSLNVFVIFIVIFIVNVFVFVFVFLMTPISFARFRFGLEGRKALKPICQNSEWVSEWVTKVGLELLGQLKKMENVHYLLLLLGQVLTFLGWMVTFRKYQVIILRGIASWRGSESLPTRKFWLLRPLRKGAKRAIIVFIIKI